MIPISVFCGYVVGFNPTGAVRGDPRIVIFVVGDLERNSASNDAIAWPLTPEFEMFQ